MAEMESFVISSRIRSISDGLLIVTKVLCWGSGSRELQDVSCGTVLCFSLGGRVGLGVVGPGHLILPSMALLIILLVRRHETNPFKQLSSVKAPYPRISNEVWERNRSRVPTGQ